MSPRIGEVRSRTIAQWTKIGDVALPIQRIIPRCRNFDPELNINSMFDNSVWCLRDKRDAIVEIFVIETRRNEKFCCYLLGRVYYPYWKHGIIRGRKRGWKQSWNSEEQSNERLRGEAKALKTDYISRVTRIVGHRLIVDYWLIVRQRRRISTITGAITR